MGATKVVGYIRVSTSQQAEEGLSLDVQRTRLKAYAVAMGLELTSIEIDAGASAKNLDRPGLQRALAALDNGQADGMLIVKLDRLTRSVRDLGNLLERYFASKCVLLSMGDSIDTRTAGGRMVLNILTSVAQWEREAVGERTKAVMSELKAQGKTLGAPTMIAAGIIDSIRTAQELYATGNYSTRSLADELNRLAVPTARGGKWWDKTVRTALNATLPGITTDTQHAQEGAPSN